MPETSKGGRRGRTGWAGRIGAGAALAGVACLWLAVLPLAAVAFVVSGLIRAPGRNERLRPITERG